MEGVLISLLRDAHVLRHLNQSAGSVVVLLPNQALPGVGVFTIIFYEFKYMEAPVEPADSFCLAEHITWPRFKHLYFSADRLGFTSDQWFFLVSRNKCKSFIICISHGDRFVLDGDCGFAFSRLHQSADSQTDLKIRYLFTVLFPSLF